MTDTRQRRLVPVTCTSITGEPDGIHLSVLTWLPRFEECATGPALCGQSANQGALPDGTAITCAGCEGYRDSYERALSGRPTAEQEEIHRLRELLGEAQNDANAGWDNAGRRAADAEEWGETCKRFMDHLAPTATEITRLTKLVGEYADRAIANGQEAEAAKAREAVLAGFARWALDQGGEVAQKAREALDHKPTGAQQ